MFNIKLKEYKERQSEIELDLSQHATADKSFYLNAEMLLNLVKRAATVFESSEPATKKILNFLLQNCKLDGKKLSFELKTPFNKVLQATTSSNLLPLLDAFRTLDWERMRTEMSGLSFLE
ncbi:MAG: hypothetical protein EXS52_02355 [Candidatus Staskawiczbacteria bacterium]|nr:hypothetical protein [Candidatus Staskawiczbacteria bacterium]